MTADLIAPPRAEQPVVRRVIPVVPIATAAVVALRMLLVARPASPDEAGFLMVASQWHVGGTSLYGNYWVDRPPLLIGLFRIADLAGGLTALRILGALAAAATVWLLASTSGRVFGHRAAGWTAVVAAGLLISPLVGSDAVNGELLAAPFIALGLRLAVEAVYSEDPHAARGAALGTGLAAVLALLVKQNMADVVVFAVVCWAVAWRTRRITGRALRDLLALAAVGGAVGYAVVMLWAMAHGTSPLGVYEATYPFRIRAGNVIAATPGNASQLRLGRLGFSALLSAGPLILVAFLAVALRRPRHPAVVWGLVAAGTYACVSILAGGSYWLHYLVQAIPVVALAAGAISVRTAPVVRVLVPAVVISAVVALVASVASPAPAPGNTVGRAIAASAQPGDTVLSAFGDADIPRATGMSSPYPYLWSLPSRTLDPHMTLLRGILAGPEAPTWVVVRGNHTLQRLEGADIRPMIETRYRLLDSICGRLVYLQRGIDRPPLHVTGTCGGLVLP
ncbi:ArnT family glycosyltransferase [Nocardioides pocheonensis]|uniref:Uncharacterized protein n=1 Tax=Nocardioides pocheonensis TaxID=661485 RepID=A0A3N0GVR7_9ACTN|nr:glycosyltransferase family 39 protein [Nocardioides pocheonensis]RNM16256.1 hypothetical protein EFL26_05710 [Nocardioides pocheonensis]